MNNPDGKPRRKTEPAGSLDVQRISKHNPHKQNMQPFSLPKIAPIKSDRTSVVLNQFVHKYFRRKSESSCLQLLNPSLLQHTTSMQQDQVDDTIKGGCQLKQLNNHGFQLQRRYRSQKRSHLRSVNNDNAVSAHSNQMLVRRTCIDEYFRVE